MTKRRSLPLNDQTKTASGEDTSDVLVGRILISGAWAKSVRDAEVASNDNGRPQDAETPTYAGLDATAEYAEHLLYAARKRG